MFKRLIERLKNRLKGMSSLTLDITYSQKKLLTQLGISLVRDMRLAYGHSFTECLFRPYTQGKTVREGLINIAVFQKICDSTDVDTTTRLLSTKDNKGRLEEAYQEMEKGAYEDQEEDGWIRL